MIEGGAMAEDLDETGHARALAARCGAQDRQATATYRPSGDRAAEAAKCDATDRFPVEDIDPTDWAAARRSYSPEQRLLVGVLERALADAGDVDPVVADDASAWMFGEALPGEGWAFEDVALALNIEPDALRKLAAKTAAPRTRRVHVYSTNTPRPTVPRDRAEDLVVAGDVAAA
jgi:hypothetical protein